MPNCLSAATAHQITSMPCFFSIVGNHSSDMKQPFSNMETLETSPQNDVFVAELLQAEKRRASLSDLESRKEVVGWVDVFSGLIRFPFSVG